MIRFMLSFAAFSLATALPLAAQEPVVTDDEVSAALETGQDDWLRMTVPVMINGQGPFQFVIDTGADRTVISRALADRLGLPSAGTAKLHAMGGSGTAKLVKVDTLSVSTNVKRHVKAAALSSRYLGADGLLGIDSLKGQRVTIDFDAGTMKLQPSSAPEDKAPENSSIIVVTARTRLGQLVLVDADANGEKVWVVVDTGSQNSVGNTRLRKLLLQRHPSTAIRPIQMVDVLGQKTNADYTVVNKLRIGGVMMGNAAIAFADAHPFKLFELGGKPSMLLGMESLRAFRRVTVDFSSRKVKFLLPPGTGGGSAAAP